jgi:hypothetical protein
MKRFAHFGVCVLMTFAIALASTVVVSASPTDIISNSGVVRDALAKLAADGLISANASDLMSERFLTREQAARLLEQGLGLKGSMAPVKIAKSETGAVRSALIELRPELIIDHVDVDAILKTLPADDTSYVGLIQPEVRVDTGGSNNPGSGVYGIYRGTLLGDLGTNTQFGLSLSNQAQDNRRIFFNDIGPHDNSTLTQAYVQFNGDRGLNFLVGRTDNNWGPAYQGGALLSDNASPLDQLRVSFPFSLGKHLGRNWNYTQLAATYDNDDSRTYFQARRIEINFNRHWSAQYEEALKADSSSLLLRAPLPFLLGKGINLSSVEQNSEFISNLGLEYQPTQEFRTYGQLLINDITSPFKGHFAGFDAGDGTSVPQRLAYLVGASAQLREGTSATVEYSITDPATYLDLHPQLAWTEVAYDNLGLPSGPNAKVLLGILSQQVTPKVTLSIEGRQRKRLDNSYPSPNSQDVDASAKYQINRGNSVGVTYHDYFQDAFPIAPGQPGYPVGNGVEPTSEANPGASTVIHELDVAYTVVF